MPFYEYQCQECGFELEVMQNINAEPLVTCESCGADKLRRKIFAAGMIFKGDGFYSTEYRGSDYAAAEKKDTEQSKPQSENSTTSSTESSSQDSSGSSESSSDSVATAESKGSQTPCSDVKTDL